VLDNYIKYFLQVTDLSFTLSVCLFVSGSWTQGRINSKELRSCSKSWYFTQWDFW